MQLIDADALKAKFERRKTMVGRDSDVDCLLDDAPRIDAIPVEWLDDKFLDYENKDLALSRAAWLIMHAWQREQEVGHG